MKVLPIIFLTAFISLNSFGQIPIINNVEPITTHPGDKLLITGSGFTAGQMQVWFDQVKGTITTSSEFSIEVIVPAQARFSNLVVLNLASGLSAKTDKKFMSSFNGSGFVPSFATPVTLAAGNSASVNDLCTCDLDMDGKPDVSATQSTGTAMMFFRNTSVPGSMSFAAATPVALATPTNNTACGDLDGDGRPEVLVTRDGTRNEVWIFKNNSITPGSIIMGAPTASTKLFLDVGQNSFRLSVRDLNADGKPEVIVSNATLSATNTNTIYVFVNNWTTKGTIAFNPVPIKLVVTGAATTYGMDTQDMDGDGKPEIVVNQFNNNGIFILKNTSAAGTVTFAPPVKIDQPGSLNHLTTADFNNDGKLDIAVTSNSGTADNVFVLINQSTSSSLAFAAAIKLSAGDSPWGIDVSDMDGDKDADIVVANIINAFVSQTKEIVVFLNNGNASFTRASINAAGIKRSKNIKSGDFDGDGKPDIAYAAINDNAPTVTTNNSIEILRNTNCFVPKILNEGTLVICPGQTIHLMSIPNAGTAFEWTNAANAVVGSLANLDVTTSDTYTLTATSEGGACIKTTSIVVNSGAGTVTDPTDITANTPVCSGDDLNLQAVDDGGTYTYLWTGPNNFNPASAKTQTINDVTSAHAGSYTLQLKNASGCVSNVISKTVEIVNLDNFVISTSVASNQVCQGSTLTLSVNTAVGHTYQWIKDGADISGSASPSLAVTAAGVYKVRVTNSALGCSVETDPITTSVLTKPVSLFTPSSVSTCVNQNVTFTNTSTVDPAATTVYNWDFGDGSNSTVAAPSHTYTTAATRTVTLSLSYPGVTGCSATSSTSIVVAVPTVPVISATANPICPGDETTLSVTGTFATYSWTGGATTPTLMITQPETYAVTTTEANGCTATGQLTITSKVVPTLAVTYSNDGGVPAPIGSGPLTVAPGASIQLEVSGADAYVWTPADGLTSPTLANPVATIDADITYTVTGSVTAGCSAEQAVVFVVDAALGVWNPPNVFSPNGDSQNDLWIIPSVTSYAECTLSIFNKQGGKIFEQKGYTNNWDGMYEGRELPEGTYYYVLTCPDEKPITGNVLIAR